MNEKKRRSLLRSARYEKFEERLALSAQPIAALDDIEQTPAAQHAPPLLHHAMPLVQPAQLDSQLPAMSHMVEPDFSLGLAPATQVTEFHTQLANAHQQTGVDDVHANFGLSGAKQTIVIIDSGIDYLHENLGGGFGANYRVVGGYDFAENDADPYDDPGAGWHGTHVAGIVASDHGTHKGVAYEADIVALRVFNDAGDGNFSWAEDALQWVHDNRNAFENPITAVNLSIGAQMNSNSVPFWANLENEFATLKADGIFTAVSAGNWFTTYNTPGLSYPAVSPHVVPVSSVDDNGLMSSFSQRHDRVLAAPGAGITSTVPDHMFGADGNHTDFGGASGTSMAAPYVAGASMLVREAMEFVGTQNINQDLIYNHFRDTADVFFDSATNANYHRINVEAAINALMPVDDYGDSVNDAHSLGTVNDGSTFNGTIGAVADADFFTFTAGATGDLTLTTTETHNLETTWQLDGGGSTTGTSFTFEVVSGQTYTFSMSTNDGIGHYGVTADLEESSSATDWGQVEQMHHNDINLSQPQTLYQFEATRTGQLTVEAFFAHANGDVNLELVNANNVVVASSNSSTDDERLDVTVNQGDIFTLRANGQNADVDFRLTNLVSISGATTTVNGTAGDDVFAYSKSNDTATVNGVVYDVTGATAVNFLGGAGANSITAVGTGAQLTAEAGSMSMIAGGGVTVTTSAVQSMDVTGNGGLATLNGTTGDDTFTADPTVATFSGTGLDITARSFGQVNANGGGGNDVATLNDSAGNDMFYGRSTYAYLMGSGYLNQAIGFDQVDANASTGTDLAKLYDTAGGTEQFMGRETYSFIQGSNYLNVAYGFDQTDAYSTGGGDTARVFDTTGDDIFVGRETYAYMQSSSVVNVAWGFANTIGQSSAGGNDVAMLFDSSGDDMFVGRETYSYMSGSSYTNTAEGFGDVTAYSSSGNDIAYLYDSSGDDLYSALPQKATLSGSGFSNTAYSFARVEAFASGGDDHAELWDSGGDDRYTGRVTYSYLEGDGFMNVAHGFTDIEVFATNGGHDVATLYDSSGDDFFYGRSEYAFMLGSGFLNTTWRFDRVDAYASTGNDVAKLFDTNGNEAFYGRSTYAFVQGDAYLNVANNFDQVDAYASGGFDVAYFTDSAGDDVFYGRESYSYIMGTGFLNVAWGYDMVSARSIYGGNDQANLFGSAGADTLSRNDLTVQLAGSGFDNRVEGFGVTRAYGRGGADTAVFSELGAGDSIFGRSNYAVLDDSDSEQLTIYDFEDVDAWSDAGGSPTTDLDSLDYVFEELGDWT